MKHLLSLKAKQQLSMTPYLQQAIRLLQLSAEELECEIQKALETNPLLERAEPSEATATNDYSAKTPEEFAYMDRLQKVTGFDKDRHFTEETLDPFLLKSAETTLHQHLLWQMELAHFSDQEMVIAAAIIDAISEEGYLIFSLEDIQNSLEIKVTLEELKTVLYRIQQFDPIGVGARSLAECLTLQLNSLPATLPWLNETKEVVKNHLELLGKKKYNHLQEMLKVDKKDIQEMMKILLSLNPKPGNAIEPKKSDYINPDLIAFKKNGRLIVELNKDTIPNVRVNPYYEHLLKNKTIHKQVLRFKETLKEAKWFLKGLQTRHDTLLNVARCIMEQQQPFLEEGEGAIKPLNRFDIARKLGVHESTISRITTHKTIMTPRGLFELTYFFSNAVGSPTGSVSSAKAICALIKKMIAEESSQSPLSDDKLAKMLLERGINIARRTVSKYREAMHIPPSHERKNLSVN